MVAVVFAVYICTQWQHSMAVKFTTWQQPLYTMAATVYITALKLWVGLGWGNSTVQCITNWVVHSCHVVATTHALLLLIMPRCSEYNVLWSAVYSSRSNINLV